MMPLPPAPFDACGQATSRVSSQALVRYRTNDYSVPVAYGHRDVWIRGYVNRVVIGCGGQIIARHPRSYDREDMIFDPVHYLPLIEKKSGALDRAAPLVGWELPSRLGNIGSQTLVICSFLRCGRRSLRGGSPDNLAVKQDADFVPFGGQVGDLSLEAAHLVPPTPCTKMQEHLTKEGSGDDRLMHCSSDE
jgi:hypothetical protein